MNQTRREFLRGAVGWGGLLLAGSLKLAAVTRAEPIRRARGYFAARQSADGAWRSGRYAAFRDGDVLTPVVLWALQAGRDGEAISSDGTSYARGLQWLRDFTDAHCGRKDPWVGLQYPLFTACYSAQVLARSGDADRAAAWVKIIEALRTSEPLGWPAGDVMCGAWSDASAPPRYAAPVPDMLAPNISATALAVGTLAATGRAERTLGARRFIESCQNFAEDQPGEFDDGGFFFAIGDSIRNKAGSAGRDAEGHERFHSYGSATCDGMLALHACGFSLEHPRLRAAADWLRRNSDGLTHAGRWPSRRTEARESLAFYQSQALASVLSFIAASGDWVRRQSASLVSALAVRQNSDGSWQGLAPDSCEDEPLLASAFALRALSLLA